MKSESSVAHLLEGDGVVSNLFFFLWKRAAAAALYDDDRRKRKHKRGGPGDADDAPAIPRPLDEPVSLEGMLTAVAATKAYRPSGVPLRVPSTVVVEHNFPKAWYTTAGGGDIDRKLGREVDTKSILQDFSCHGKYGPGHRSVGEVVATYSSVIPATATEQAATRVEFLDYGALYDLLLRRTRRPDGILQKWIPTSGAAVTTVQVVWSPHVCVVRKRRNNEPALDRRIGLYDRCVTFEGPPHLSKEVMVATVLENQVRSVCADLVAYLFASHRVAVQRMLLHLKVDRAGHLWLLYCGSMRVTSRSLLNLAPVYLQRDLTAEAQALAEETSRCRRMLQHEAFERALPTSDDDDEDLGAALTPRHDALVPVPPATLASPRDVQRQRRALTARRPPPTPSRPLLQALCGMAPRPPSMGPIGELECDAPKMTSCRSVSTHHPHITAPAATRPRPPATPRADMTRRLSAPSGRSSRASWHSASRAALQRRESQRSVDRIAEQLARMRAETTAVVAGAALPERGVWCSGRDLWRIARAAVLSGAVRTVGQQREVREWCGSLLYGVYSHFTCTKTPLAVSAPRTLRALLGDGWLDDVGLTVAHQPELEAAPEAAPAAPRMSVSESFVLAPAEAPTEPGIATCGVPPEPTKPSDSADDATGDSFSIAEAAAPQSASPIPKPEPTAGSPGDRSPSQALVFTDSDESGEEAPTTSEAPGPSAHPEGATSVPRRAPVSGAEELVVTAARYPLLRLQLNVNAVLQERLDGPAAAARLRFMAKRYVLLERLRRRSAGEARHGF